MRGENEALFCALSSAAFHSQGRLVRLDSSAVHCGIVSSRRRSVSHRLNSPIPQLYPPSVAVLFILSPITRRANLAHFSRPRINLQYTLSTSRTHDFLLSDQHVGRFMLPPYRLHNFYSRLFIIAVPDNLKRTSPSRPAPPLHPSLTVDARSATLCAPFLDFDLSLSICCHIIHSPCAEGSPTGSTYLGHD